MSFARAALLLCLVAHASLVTATHHHPGAGQAPRPAACTVEASPSDGSKGPLGTNRDTCCPSCCLQRNFVNSINPISIPPDVCPEPVTADAFVLESSSNGVILVLSSRAPPLT